MCSIFACTHPRVCACRHEHLKDSWQHAPRIWRFPLLPALELGTGTSMPGFFDGGLQLRSSTLHGEQRINWTISSAPHYGIFILMCHTILFRLILSSPVLLCASSSSSPPPRQSHTWTPLPSPPHSLRMPSSPPMGTHRIRCTSSVNPGSAMFWLLDMHIWLISLNMMISRSTHLPANVMISFFFICSSPDVHLDYVPFPGYCDKCSTNHG